MKEENKILSFFNQYLKIKNGYERLVFVTLIFILLVHIATCLWIVAASFHTDTSPESTKRYEHTWLEPFAKEYKTDAEFYCVAFYWTITTITTVGYGDISATNLIEMVFASIMMLIGVVSFSFANGALAFILTNSDNQNGHFEKKKEILNKAKKEFKIPEVLFRKLKKSINYTISNDQDELNNFI